MAPSWTDLPVEIRLRILQFVIEPQRDRFPLVETPLYHNIGSYAVVNHEWRDFVESVTMRRLLVNADRIGDFQRLFEGALWRRQRRKYVSTISFDIHLPEPDEVDMWTPETTIVAMQDRNSAVLTRSLARLFFVLSLWRVDDTRTAAADFGNGTGTGDAEPIGVTLEIVLHGNELAPPLFPDYVDTEHYDNRLRLDPRFLQPLPRHLIEAMQPPLREPWPEHSESPEQPPEPWSEQWTGPQFLPRLDFIRRLCIPAHAWPTLPARTLSLIVSHLTGLKRIAIERLGDEADILARHVDLDLTKCLAELPRSIEHISLFEEPSSWAPPFARDFVEPDSDDEHQGDSVNTIDDPGQADDANGVPIAREEPRITTTRLVRQAVERSQKLTSFAVSFWMDASDFLHDFVPGSIKRHRSSRLDCVGGPYWPDLQTLTLTCHRLHKRQKASTINTLITMAAEAAMQMPKLRLLEIYNVKKGRVSALFRYTATSEAATMTWESDWSFRPSKKACKAWEQVAQFHAKPELKTEFGNVRSPPIMAGFDPDHDMVPLVRLQTRNLALYEESARQYWLDYVEAYAAAQNPGDPMDQEDGWETVEEMDED